MNPDPFSVTAIIPVLNGEAFLYDAVHSILQQAYQPLELLIVDGGSTDTTASIAASFGDAVRFIPPYPEHGLGSARNRNTGLRLAQGNIIAFLDADDLWSTNKLQLQLAHFSADPTIDIVLGRTQKIQHIGFQDGKAQFKNWKDPELALSPGSALFRKTVFDTVGPFDETLRFANDWDWFMRARECGIIMRTHAETVQYYRRHGANMTEQVEAGNHDTLVMLKKSLTRRRQNTTGPVTSLPPLPAPDFSASDGSETLVAKNQES